MCGVLGHCRRHPSVWLPAGTPADGFWGRTRWSRGGFGSFARQIWLEKGENFASWILPDPGRPGDPKVGSHSDCVVSWDTVGGIQALGCPQGPPPTGFGVAQDGPVEVLALFVRQSWLENGDFFFCDPENRPWGSMRATKRLDASYSVPGHHGISVGPHLGVTWAPWV